MLYIMRHGKTDWNADRRLQGSEDIPLNEEGRQMARDARKKYGDLRFDICYCSPLQRAQETAEIFLEGSGTPILTDDRSLFIEADRAYRDGANILILSDRGVDDNHVAIPSLLAVSALQQYLVKTKKRTSLSLILESGEPREVHHFATLLGFGASAINPYLALDTVKQLIDEHMLDKDYYAAVDDYNHAIITGIVKIAAKMGISTIQSYQGSKIFEALGIDKDVIDKYFTNTVSRIGGISIKDIENDVNTLHSAAYDPLGLETDVTLDSKGRHKMRSGADAHLYNPATIHLLQQSTKRGLSLGKGTTAGSQIKCPVYQTWGL